MIRVPPPTRAIISSTVQKPANFKALESVEALEETTQATMNMMKTRRMEENQA